ncbi:hypothetical protein [Deinococcus knuensis]|nr:hypothetical protein [Deinococcus knuensis]
MTDAVLALPRKPDNRTHHASSLPKLRQPLWPLDLHQIRVVAMDANVLVDLAKSCAKANGAEQSALLEQLHAGRIRVFISHQDVEPVESMIHPGVTIERIERSMEKVASLKPRPASDWQTAWRTHLRPWMHVLDPTGMPASEVHADVMMRDADDADLALIAEMLGVDAFLSRDGRAFAPTFLPVLPSVQHVGGQSSPGVLNILAAWRNESRVHQYTSTLALPPAVVTAAVKEGIHALSRTTKVHPALLLIAGVALGTVAFRAFPTDSRTSLKRSLLAYLDHTMEIQQTLEEQTYDRALRAWCELPTWESATDFRIIAARHLARARRPVPVATLAELGGVTPRTAGMRLRKHPGLFREWQCGLWSLVPCTAELL